MKKRIITVLLCLVMVVGLLPVTAQAAEADKTIQLGTGSITGYSATGYDYLYMGEYNPPNTTWFYPLKWRVLDTKTNTGSDGGLLLLSEYVLKLFIDADSYMFERDSVTNYHSYTAADGTTEYHRGAALAEGASHDACVLSNVWQGSAIQTYYKTKPFFTSDEYAAILATTKNDGAHDSGSATAGKETWNLTTTPTTNILNGDRLFYLSAEEASNAAYGFNNDDSRKAKTAEYDGTYKKWDIYEEDWCLRSPIAPIEGSQIDKGARVSVTYDGALSCRPANSGADIARPAFNLDKNAVLFISAFDFAFNNNDGKAKDAKDVTAGQLAAIGTCAEGGYAGNSWRPTLKDGSRAFAVTETTATAAAGGSITLHYTGAETDAIWNSEYISAIIADSTGSTVLYYGRVKEADSADGTVGITIPAALANGSYTLYVFNEQCDDYYSAGISSAFQKVALTVSSSTKPVDPVDPSKPVNPGDHTHHTGANGSDKTEKLESPKTGDSSMVGLWVTLLLVSGAGVAGTVVYSRRRRA